MLTALTESHHHRDIAALLVFWACTALTDVVCALHPLLNALLMLSLQPLSSQILLIHQWLFCSCLSSCLSLFIKSLGQGHGLFTFMFLVLSIVNNSCNYQWVIGLSIHVELRDGSYFILTTIRHNRYYYPHLRKLKEGNWFPSPGQVRRNIHPLTAQLWCVCAFFLV